MFHKKCNIHIAQKSVINVFSQCICVVTTRALTQHTQMGTYIQCILCIMYRQHSQISLCSASENDMWHIRKILQFSSVYTVVSCTTFLAIQYSVKLWITKLRCDLLNYTFCVTITERIEINFFCKKIAKIALDLKDINIHRNCVTCTSISWLHIIWYAESFTFYLAKSHRIIANNFYRHIILMNRILRWDDTFDSR